MRLSFVALGVAFLISSAERSTVSVQVTSVDYKEPHLRFTATDATGMLHLASGQNMPKSDTTIYTTPARFTLDRRPGDVIFTSVDKRFRIRVAADVPNVLAMASEAMSVTVRQTDQQIVLLGGRPGK